MITLHFESLSACVDNARMPFRRKANLAKFRTVINHSHSRAWHGIDGGFPAVSNMVEFTGYPEGGQLIAEMLDNLVESLPRALGIRRKKRRAELGDEYDIHAAMRGDHDRAWIQSRRELRSGAGLARIIVDIGDRASVPADQLQWRGVAGIVLCTMLREAGYSVDMIAAFASQRPFANESLLFTVTVSGRHASVDPDTLAAVLVLPGFFRTFGFAGIIRAADNHHADVVPKLGFPVPVVNVYDPVGDMPDFVVPSSVMSDETARGWVKDSIALIQGSQL